MPVYARLQLLQRLPVPYPALPPPPHDHDQRHEDRLGDYIPKWLDPRRTLHRQTTNRSRSICGIFSVSLSWFVFSIVIAVNSTSRLVQVKPVLHV
jgi:hypothetical protein